MPSVGNMMRDYRFWACMFVIATIVLAYLTLVRAPTIQIGPDVRNRTMHFLAYFTYGAVAAMWRITAKPVKSRWMHFLEASIPTAFYGVVLEWLQMYLPHRHTDPINGLCNLIGAFAGAAVVSFVLAERLNSINMGSEGG
jgi:VanZ family protein